MPRDAGDKDGERGTREERLAEEVQELREKLREAEETSLALRSGDGDAPVDLGPEGERVSTLREAYYAYRVFVESINEGAATLTADGRVLYCNRRFAEMLQQPLDKVIGEPVFSFLGPESRDLLEALLKEGLDGSARGEVDLHARDGALLLSVQASCQIAYVEDLHRICLLFTELSERKRSEADLREAYEQVMSSERQLKERAAELDRKNVALRELIEQFTLEKSRIREDVTANIRHSVLPILEKLRVEARLEPHIKAIRRLLEDLTSSYSRELARIGSSLTLKEKDLCRMIKGGLTSKEVAQALSVSVQTVEKQRKSIRRKLGITNRAIDLGAFLNKF
jgi:PAS domain S-box-containing protein